MKKKQKSVVGPDIIVKLNDKTIKLPNLKSSCETKRSAPDTKLMIESNITIKIGDQTIKLTGAQAKTLRDQLNEILGDAFPLLPITPNATPNVPPGPYFDYFKYIPPSTPIPITPTWIAPYRLPEVTCHLPGNPIFS